MADQTNDRGAVANALAGDNQTNGATQQTNGTNQQTNGAAATGAEKHWYSDLPAETQGFLEGKHWNSPTGLPKLIKGYQELEKQFSSADKIMLPKDDKDTEGYNKLYTKLGRPESADKYTFPEGVDPNVVKSLAPKLHELGITQKQAQALAQLDIDRANAAQQAQAEASKADQNAAMPQLQAEWGDKFNENVELARRAMRGLGMNLDQHFTPMAMAIGAKNAMKLLQLAGINTRESNAASIGDAQAGFGLTPNQAKAELAEKGAELMERARKGDKAAIAHRLRLIKAIAGDGMIDM